jgi:KaiC/GvpD/RAD55 family RecA-like ATPase
MLDKKIVSADPEFRLKIISMLVNTDWMLHYGAILSPDYFEADAEKEIVDWCNKFYTKYSAIPDIESLRHGCYGNKLVPALYDTEGDLRYAVDVALDFARVQAMKLAILASVEAINKGDLYKPLELVEEARSVGVDMHELGKELVADAEDWVYDQLHGKRVPTGWMDIDLLLGGGLCAGEYLLVMGPSGRGKTLALVNIGYAAAGLLSCANVLHIAWEGSRTAALKRYAARLTGVRLRRDESFLASESDYDALVRDKADRVLKGRIRVVQPERTMEGIKRTYKELKAIGFNTGLLIVDYLDLMRASRKRTDYRFEIADNTRDLIEFGALEGFPVVSATQVGRHAFNKEVIVMTDVAESIEKVNASDVIVAICQTEDEEALGRGRLYMAKLRDAPGGQTYPVKIDKERQMMVLTHD